MATRVEGGGAAAPLAPMAGVDLEAGGYVTPPEGIRVEADCHFGCAGNWHISKADVAAAAGAALSVLAAVGPAFTGAAAFYSTTGALASALSGGSYALHKKSEATIVALLQDQVGASQAELTRLRQQLATAEAALATAPAAPAPTAPAAPAIAAPLPDPRIPGLEAEVTRLRGESEERRRALETARGLAMSREVLLEGYSATKASALEDTLGEGSVFEPNKNLTRLALARVFQLLLTRHWPDHTHIWFPGAVHQPVSQFVTAELARSLLQAWEGQRARLEGLGVYRNDEIRDAFLEAFAQNLIYTERLFTKTTVLGPASVRGINVAIPDINGVVNTVARATIDRLRAETGAFG